ncbi:MAG: hypothetical protein KJO35_11085, partial [Gammaproteobacteria bacterium]|nr:hypothetical protein [Gammaproteobacteria bacterium]
TAPAGDKEAAQAMQRIEQALLSAKVLRIEYEIEATGVVEAKLSGDLLMQQPALAAIRASGDFNEAATDVRLVANGERMKGGSEQRSFDEKMPVDLRNGLLLGLTRMGMLHNLAMLVSGAAPQGTDGSVQDWAQAKVLNWQKRNNEKNTQSIAFLLDVGGEPAGEVVLTYDNESGLPVGRRQTVHFATGDMQVTERYRIRTGGIIGPCRFSLQTK